MAEINYINGYEIADAKARGDASEALLKSNSNSESISDLDAEIVLEKSTRESTDITLQNQITSLASGAPKNVYATTAALESANPDTGVYLVSADGHIYSWIKDGSSATDLGVYQATVDSDTVKRLDETVDYINHQSSNLADLSKSKIGYYANSGVYHDDNTNITTVKILVKGGSTVKFKKTSLNLQAGAIFDSDDTFIEGLNFSSGQATAELDVTETYWYRDLPDDAYYVWANIPNNELSSFMFIENGDYPLSFVKSTNIRTEVNELLANSNVLKYLNAIIYVANRGSVETYTDNNGYAYVKCSNSIIIKNNDGEYTISSSDAQTQLGSSNVTVDGNSMTIRISANQLLVFDLITHTLKYRSRTAVVTTDLILETNGYGCPAGFFSNYESNQTVKPLNTYLNYSKAIIYIANRGKVNITTDDNGYAYINCANSILIKNKQNNYEITAANAQTQLGSGNVTVDGNAMTIKLGSSNMLVFDLISNTLKFRTQSTVTVTDLILETNGYGCPAGFFSNYESNQTVKSLTSSLNSRISANDAQENAFVSSYNTLSGWEDHAKNFAKKFSDVENGDAFLFFTDAHILDENNAPNTWKNNCYAVMSYIERLYYATACSFALNGGDWLGAFDSYDSALYKLSFINGFMRKKFPKYAMLLGNHDTNYQGYIDAQYQGKTPEQAGHAQDGRLPQMVINNTYFADRKKAYYILEAPTFKLYCFDTGIETSNLTTDYYRGQVNWFANSLLTEDAKHIAIAMHIVMESVNDENSYHDMFKELTACANAYNNRTTYTYNGVTYDYSSISTLGKVAFAIGGHSHADKIGTYNNIPYILTTNATGYGNYNTIPLDLCLIDWDNAVLYAYRAERNVTGSTRNMNIIV